MIFVKCKIYPKANPRESLAFVTANFPKNLGINYLLHSKFTTKT